MAYYTTIVVYIDCILSNICGILYYNCGINQWWNRVNFLKKISNGNYKKILFDSYCLNDFWILGIGIIVKIQRKKICVYHICSILYHICGSKLPHMWYTIPQMWIPRKSLYCYTLGKTQVFSWLGLVSRQQK